LIVEVAPVEHLYATFIATIEKIVDIVPPQHIKDMMLPDAGKMVLPFMRRLMYGVAISQQLGISLSEITEMDLHALQGIHWVNFRDKIDPESHIIGHRFGQPDAFLHKDKKSLVAYIKQLKNGAHLAAPVSPAPLPASPHAPAAAVKAALAPPAPVSTCDSSRPSHFKVVQPAPLGGHADSGKHHTCQVTALFNDKGGSGKTTTAINLGATLTKEGLKMLLIDFDGSGNSTSFFHPAFKTEQTVYIPYDGLIPSGMCKLFRCDRCLFITKTLESPQSL